MVTWLVTVAAIVVGVVFVVAGATKLAAGPRWRSDAADLGAPGWIAPFVPWIELVVGALLIVQIAEPWVAIFAAATLVAFSALIAARLRAGERPSCACFGQWSASEVGPGHLVRNGVLFALAIVAAFG